MVQGMCFDLSFPYALLLSYSSMDARAISKLGTACCPCTCEQERRVGVAPLNALPN